jgi:hypothetical protein
LALEVPKPVETLLDSTDDSNARRPQSTTDRQRGKEKNPTYFADHRPTQRKSDYPTI